MNEKQYFLFRTSPLSCVRVWSSFFLLLNSFSVDTLSLSLSFLLNFGDFCRTQYVITIRYGLPTVGNLPNGFTPLAEIWGKGKNRFPLLVVMNHPLSWVVTLPNNDVNGEDGTIQAGEYAKGDTATLYVYEEEGHINVRKTYNNNNNKETDVCACVCVCLLLQFKQTWSCNFESKWGRNSWTHFVDHLLSHRLLRIMNFFFFLHFSSI